MGSQPNHQQLVRALNELCDTAIVDIETGLANQKVADAAKARWIQEQKRMDEMAQLAAARAEKEKLKREALRRAEKDANEEDEDSDSAPEKPVHLLFSPFIPL